MQSIGNNTERIDIGIIKSSIPIIDLATELGLSVVRNRARCMFPERHAHGDRTPSLSFDTTKNLFKCWVCPDVKGSVIDLVMNVKGISFAESVALLSEKCRLSPKLTNTGNSEARLRSIGHKSASSNGKQNFKSNSHVLNHLVNYCSGLGDSAIRYLEQRRISKRTAKMMKLGFVDKYDLVSEYLKNKFGMEELYNTGLFNEKGNFRFYQHRLLFPYIMNGKVEYIQGRSIDSSVTPKELNLPGKIPCPFNYDSLKSYSMVYLCEGVIDTLTLINQGFPAVGIPGIGGFKEEWLAFFRGKKVMSVLDADAAGRMANERLKSLFIKNNIDFTILQIPDGHDINDFFSGKTWKK